MQEYHDYFAKIKEQYARGKSTNEAHGRTPLENLLNAVASQIDKKFEIRQEKTADNRLIPDFTIEHGDAIIGYVETKKFDESLDEVLKSEQIANYKALNSNILITNYKRWILLKEGETIDDFTLFSSADLDKPRSSLTSEDIDKLNSILKKFLRTEPSPIGDVKKLAEALAIRTRHLKDCIEASLELEERGRLRGLYKAFKNQLHPQLSLEDFADTYAQMLSYGLFLAKLNDDKGTIITLKNAEEHVPKPFKLIHELVIFLVNLAADRSGKYTDIKWVAEEILLVINYMDRQAIAKQLSFKERALASSHADKEEAELFEKDPFVYFYEDFLAAYDKKLRKSRGVYYTPPPVVNFIVRGINDILKDKFGISDGLAESDGVTILDFACGTGTFILEIFQQILDSIGAETAMSGKAPLMIKEHLLKNIYGFEFLIAAYTIAHLKLWQYLTDKGHEFGDDERLQVFLSNTLTPTEKEEKKDRQPELDYPELSKEAEESDEVKNNDILVITGNPPYSVKSQNPGTINKKLTWIGKKIEDYKEIDGVRLKEKNPKMLQDDYVKFIRYAQYKMQSVDEGVVGIITNHGFIDNATFQGMRYSLMQTFDQIYILDLHGDTRKSEKIPEGIDIDKNVFDIKTGVSISFFVKNKNLAKGVFHADLWGSRKEKYKQLANSNFADIEWEKLDPNEPCYQFTPEDNTLKPEYNDGWPIDNIFHSGSVGITTARDNLAIQFSKDKIKKTVKEFVSMSVKTAIRTFHLGKKSGDKVSLAQDDIKEFGQGEERFQPILYRPFDTRFTYYSGESSGFMDRPRKDIMQHMFKDNCALITVKKNIGGSFNKAFVTNGLAEFHITGGDVGYVFPLYKYPEKENEADKPELTNGGAKLTSDKGIENFEKDFRNFIDKKYEHKFLPEDVIAYIYAILNSPTYRSRYDGFLKRCFPRIPLCENKQDFIKLAEIGQRLMNLHLMKELKSNSKLWQGEGKNLKIEKLEYNEKQKQLHINEQQYLEPIPKEIWEFKICSYQALYQYLDSRNGETLDLAELTHIEKMIYAIQETIKAMQAIDSLTPTIFPHWHKSPPN